MASLSRWVLGDSAGRLIPWLGVLALTASEARQWWLDRQRLRQIRQERGAAEPLRRTPKVSVLVAAWNEAAGLERHLRSVVGLRYPNLEYVICAGGEDGTYELARGLAPHNATVLLQQPSMGKWAALGECVKRASGEIAYFTDADCLLDDASLERLLAPLINGREVAASGTSAPFPGQRASDFVRHQWTESVYYTGQRGRYMDFLAGRNCAVRLDLLRDSTLWSRKVWIGEDYFLAHRLLAAGHRIRHVPESVVHTRFTEHWGDYIRQQSRWLRTTLMFGIPAHAWGQVAVALSTYFTRATLVLLPCLAPLIGRRAWTLWLVGLGYVIAKRVRFLHFAAVLDDLRPTRRTYVLATLFAPADLVATVLGLIQLVLPGRWTRW